ncbi:tigger transposable element-derived protein 1-like [Hemicordylus capensis]|uniref:tigger transposable element-derived protein 1-like n=1 Tax=Hemicordylus capensis TaxID=884348 RepID=UPI0023022D0D|nr:tigger transposable element-derived protein 1-like [Hemicordylus capensis]XP_053143784.1 tigger transposable element-derived protein 1-like [Hemicordylus capensis]
MGPKRAGKGKEDAVAKRPRNVMSLEDKFKVLDCLKEGQSNSAVGRLFRVNESTIRSIKKNEDAIRGSVASGTQSSLKVSFMPRDPNIEKMEKALNIWMEDQAQKKVPLSTRMICVKARKIYRHLVESSGEGDPEKFQASKGWFENFKKRFSLHNVKLVGEIASADQEAATTFPAKLKRLIEEEGYVPDQVFNADETGLFWKRMPNRTFIAKEKRRAPGFKAAKDRLIVASAGRLGGEGFEDIQPAEVTELLESHSEELTEQDLEALIKSSSDQEEAGEEEEDCRATVKLTLEKINRFLKHASELADEAVDMDPFMQRSLTFRRGLNELIQPYAEVQKDLGKKMAQPALLRFFKRAQPGTPEQPGLSLTGCRAGDKSACAGPP